jgi:hypothetical protein
MASDDHPIRVTAENYKPTGQGDLETWLKTAAVGPAPASTVTTSTGDNENSREEPFNDLYAVKGDEPIGNNTSVKLHHDDAVSKANVTRRGVAKRIFNEFPGAAAVEAALLAANLEHAKSGDFESHSVLLNESTKQASLADRVDQLFQD